ncbi:MULTISPECIES: hypothetical protein [unclassified Streptomyces]|uniref:hypothetical protein n=1 Tax=unclassified Streptomyces TaxID=2593676 RepID=UPI00339F1BB0
MNPTLAKPNPALPTGTLPFAARGTVIPYLVPLAVGVRYDEAQQLNVTPEGSPWHETAIAASCTNTNWDSSNDDTQDPY